MHQTTDNEQEQDIVDFVIDTPTPKSGISLPSRSETQSSPTKPTTPSAPGKLKLRWLQASKQENEDMVVSQVSGGGCLLLNNKGFPNYLLIKPETHMA